MTIRYEILVMCAPEELRSLLTEEYCCFGNIAGKFKKAKWNAGRDSYSSELRFKPESFLGFKLHLAWDNPYGQNTTKVQRIAYEKMFEELGFWKWLGCRQEINHTGKETTHTRESDWVNCTLNKFGQLDSITFKKDCPMFLAVVATGIWRLFANHKDAYWLYGALRMKRISPITSFLATTLASASGLVDQYSVEESMFNTSSFSTHMPWTYNLIDPRYQARLATLTHEDWAKLPSMYDEQMETGTLSYGGRDNFIMGCGKWTPAKNLKRKVEIESRRYNLSSFRDLWGGAPKTQYDSRTISGVNLIKWGLAMDAAVELLKSRSLDITLAETVEVVKGAKLFGTTAQQNALGKPPLPPRFSAASFAAAPAPPFTITRS